MTNTNDNEDKEILLACFGNEIIGDLFEPPSINDLRLDSTSDQQSPPHSTPKDSEYHGPEGITGGFSYLD